MPIVLDGTTGITAPDVDSKVNGLNYPDASSMGFRNRIINGDMRIDQRNNGASVTPTTNYTYNTCDRWIQFLAVSSRYSVQRNAGAVTPPTGFTNYLGATSLAATSLGATDIYALSQQIEGFNIADLGWGTASAQAVTISFWVRSSLTGTFGGALNNSGGSRSYPFSYTISAANTWEQKTLTVPGDTTGTWLTDNGIGLFLLFSLGSGTTRSGTAGSWSGSYFTSATGAVSVVGTNGATFYITGVQLEAGSVATPFERRDFGRELMMCQRYYENMTTDGKRTICSGYNAGGSFNYITQQFKTTMRAVPTVTLSSFTNGNSGNAAVNGANTQNVEIVNQNSALGWGFSQFNAVASSEL